MMHSSRDPQTERLYNIEVDVDVTELDLPRYGTSEYREGESNYKNSLWGESQTNTLSWSCSESTSDRSPDRGTIGYADVDQASFQSEYSENPPLVGRKGCMAPDPIEGWGGRGYVWCLAVLFSALLMLTGVIETYHENGDDTPAEHYPGSPTGVSSDGDTSFKFPSPPEMDKSLSTTCSLSSIASSRDNLRKCEKQCLAASCCRILEVDDPHSCLLDNREICTKYEKICSQLDDFLEYERGVHDRSKILGEKGRSGENKTSISNEKNVTTESQLEAMHTAEAALTACTAQFGGSKKKCLKLCEPHSCCFTGENNCLKERGEECIEYAVCKDVLKSGGTR